MEEKTNFNIIEELTKCLNHEEYKKALEYVRSKDYEETLKDNTWDIIPVVINSIEDETILLKPSLYKCCEDIITELCALSNPDEMLLELIEQVELAKNDAQFLFAISFLKPLLAKTSVNINKVFDWCFNSINAYLKKIVIPNIDLEDNERLLLDSDTNVRRCLNIYSTLPNFYDSFVSETVTANDNKCDTKEVMLSFLVSLLGKPLIDLDVSPDMNAMSEARSCAQHIMSCITKLQRNILYFMKLIDEKCLRISQPTEIEGVYDENERITAISLGGLYFNVFVGQFALEPFIIPQVYCPSFLVTKILPLCVELLNENTYEVVSKGIKLSNELLQKLSTDVSSELLDAQVYYHLCEKLMNVAIYCPFKGLRKSALNVLHSEVSMFDYEGRCMLINCILGKANHSGMIGYAIKLYKDSLHEAMTKAEIFPECFQSAQFYKILKQILNLPFGAESDLIELADQIITALNFIIYIVQKDKNDMTGIKNMIPKIEKEYLGKLRDGLKLSRAHYEVKLRDLNEGKKSNTDGCDIQMNVCGEELQHVPIEGKLQVVISALNAFHLMEGLMARVQECFGSISKK